MGRTRRPPQLTEEERRLWEGVARSVRRLARRGRAAAAEAPAGPAAAPTPSARPPAASSPAARPAASVRPQAPPAPPPLAVGVAPGGVDAARLAALRAGRLRPERRLDLHHQRASHAHALVARFVPDSRAEGCRCVEIVTGRGAGPEGGVLRRELPHWLNAPELRRHILALAHPRAGAAGENTGSVLLLLRRAEARGGARKDGRR